MEKALKNTSVIVRNPETGEFVTVHGFGALKDSGFTIRPGIDLTKPIYEQVLKLDRDEERKRKRAERKLEQNGGG